MRRRWRYHPFSRDRGVRFEVKSGLLVAEVTIITVVESLASCKNSVAVIMQSGGSLGSERGVPIKDLLLTDQLLSLSIFALSMSIFGEAVRAPLTKLK